MAFPVIETTAESSTNTAGTSHTVTLPSGIVAGDLILLLGSIGSTAATLNAHGDYTELLDENAAVGLKILYRWATGGEANPTFTSSASTRSAWVAYRISGAENPSTQAPQIGTTATGTSTTPDPPASAAPGSTKDYLFIAVCGSAGEQADDDTYVTSFPTNYTLGQAEKTCGTAGTNLGGLIGAAARQLNTGAAENPGTFTVSENAAWRAQTVMVHPATVTTVTPSPTSATWATAAPTLQDTLTPSPPAATWAAVAPGSELALALAAPPAATWAAVVPDVALVTLVTPDPVVATWSPRVGFEGFTPALTLAITPGPAAATWATAAPTLALALEPAPPAAAWSAVTPAGALTVPAGAASVAWAVPPVTAELVQTVTPDPVSAAWSVAPPTVVLGAPPPEPEEEPRRGGGKDKKKKRPPRFAPPDPAPVGFRVRAFAPAPQVSGRLGVRVGSAAAAHATPALAGRLGVRVGAGARAAAAGGFTGAAEVDNVVACDKELAALRLRHEEEMREAEDLALLGF